MRAQRQIKTKMPKSVVPSGFSDFGIFDCCTSTKKKKAHLSVGEWPIPSRNYSEFLARKSN
jgi:hypothetical protein